MKALIRILFLTFIVHLTAFAQAKETTTVEVGQSVYVSVNGLVCDFCARALEKVFGREESVHDIDVDLDAKVITIRFNQGADMTDVKIKQLIVDSGYNVETIRRG